MTKVYHVWAEKSTEESYFMTLKCDTKFEEKLTCGLENHMRNLANFYQIIRQSQNSDPDGILLPKVENIWALKITGELCVMKIKNDAKFK